jgi:hypothetical protein
MARVRWLSTSIPNLGTIRHRTEHVEYRIEQHQAALADRLPFPGLCQNLCHQSPTPVNRHKRRAVVSRCCGGGLVLVGGALDASGAGGCAFTRP